MFSVKTAVATALTSSVVLNGLVGDNIFFHHPESFIAENLPSVSYFEIDNTESLHADDVEIGSSIFLQLDVWSKASTTSIAKEVDVIMKSLDFNRISPNPDLYEKDTKIHHKVLNYKLDYSDPDF